MEKISAACALGWSIELEKGLRSRISGYPVESINLIGPRLQQWSKELPLTMAVYELYGLVPGEDRLFADAILLRLADAFVSGDKDMKISVVKVFFSILKHCKSNDRQAHGIFSNMSEESRLEFLRRVKVVLTAESIKFRSLALILFGCCAAIAKDVAEIRLAILSTLFSSHVLEVKGSLFAAGCFSEISDDFGYVFLESLLNLINSPKTLPALKISSARSFSKLGCSILLAMKSYKAGAELAGKALEEDVLAAMLIALTKLSLKAFVLIFEQVGLLHSFLSENTSSHLKATVLRCIRSIVAEAACFLPIGPFPLQKLFRMLDEQNTPSLCCEVLHIFHKMLAYRLSDMLFTDSDDFLKLLKYVDNATSSPIFSIRLLAFQILMSIFNQLKGRDELMSKVNTVTSLTGVVSAISNQITPLLRVLASGTSSAEVECELKSLLKLLLLLAKNNSELGSLILDGLDIAFKNTISLQDMSSVESSEVHKIVDVGGNQKFPVRMLMFFVYRFLVALLEPLGESGAISNEVVCKLTQLVSVVCDNSLFDCSLHTFFALLLHSVVNRSHLPIVYRSTSFAQGLNGSLSKLLESEALINGCVKNMLVGGDNWFAYKAGRYAMCEGGWYVASVIFQNLEAKVQSGFCCQWLKFLAQFAHSEKNVKVLLQQASLCLPPDQVVEPSNIGSSSLSIISSEYIEKLVHAFDGVSLSDKILEGISVHTQTCFQRWFLALRLKGLFLLVDILKLLNGCFVIKAEPSFQKMKDIMFSLVGVSARLSSVAEEYDLICSSFVDLDSESLEVISVLAFSCSMLACCAELTHLIANSLVSGDQTRESGYFQCVIVKDLAVRLCHIDSETCMNLMLFMKEYQVHERSSHMLPGFKMSKSCLVSKDLLTLCRSSFTRLIGLWKGGRCVDNEDTSCQVYKSCMQLLLNTMEGWIHIPFRTPKYFFRVRPTPGAQLIIQSAGSRKQDEILVSQGSQLPLNMCIQLKNLTPDVCSRFSKIHCILHCKTLYLGTRGNEQPCGAWTDYQALETGTMIDMNKKLQCHVMKQINEFMNCGDHESNGETAETYACFETNGGMQGFSTCVLDVSAFPVGCFRIYWLSGGVDHQGAYWSFLPLNPCPQFSVTRASSVRL